MNRFIRADIKYTFKKMVDSMKWDICVKKKTHQVDEPKTLECLYCINKITL